MENILKIGLVSKPQGINGQLKVVPLTDDLNRFKKLKNVLIDGKSFSVLNAKIGLNEIFISLNGINDRNTAETFRGKFLCVERKDAVDLKENTFFVADLIGLTIKSDCDIVLGKITDITSAKTDYITIKTENGKIGYFPFLKDLLIKVDLQSNVMIVDKKRFDEVICFED
ncbi:MAG: ribosome maturation factor RimM [Clostridia bacterium]|nr:ribosome maturation factor RimM [Clostridia bacterium]